MHENDETPAEKGASGEGSGKDSGPQDSGEPQGLAAASSDNKGLNLLWLPDSFKAPPQEPDVLVHGFMRRGELIVVGGPRAAQKSWLALNLAIVLGRGEGDFLGKLRVERAARVLVCHGEMDHWMAYQRWAKLVGPRSEPDTVAECFDAFRVRVVRRRLAQGDRDSDGWSQESEDFLDATVDLRLEAAIIEHGIEVVILDPWAGFYAGEENSNDQVEAALGRLRQLALRHGVAFVLIHHFGKQTGGSPPADAEDRWRGASRLADWASTRVTLLPHYTPSAAKKQGMTRQQARRYMDLNFLRRAEPTEDFSIRFDPETGWWNHWADGGQAAGSHTGLATSDVAARCRAAGGWSSVREAAAALGIAEATAKKLLDKAAAGGELKQHRGSRGAIGYRPC